MANVDLHQIRSSLKLVRDTGESALYDNRGDAVCPVCGEVFDEVLETTESSRSIRPNQRLAFCLVNEAERVVLFTHA